MNLKDYFKLGTTQRRLAKRINVKPAQISHWLSGLRPVPIASCTAIEQITDNQVTRRDLRPNDWGDIWPELINKQNPWPANIAQAATKNISET